MLARSRSRSRSRAACWLATRRIFPLGLGVPEALVLSLASLSSFAFRDDFGGAIGAVGRKAAGRTEEGSNYVSAYEVRQVKRCRISW